MSRIEPRLRRLEAAHGEAKMGPGVLVVASVTPDRRYVDAKGHDGPLIGYRTRAGEVVMRQPKETDEKMQARALAQFPPQPGAGLLLFEVRQGISGQDAHKASAHV